MARLRGRVIHHFDSAEEREEFALLLVVLLDAAGEDFVIPAVDLEGVVSERTGYGGLGAEVGQLRDYIASDDGGELGVLALFWAKWLAMAERALDVMQPAACFGQFSEALAVEGGFEGSAIGVAAEDDVLYLEDFDGVFDGGGDAVDVVAADGNYVADAAGEEEISGAGLEDEVGDDAGIRTGDKEVFRSLHLGQEMKLLPLGWKNFTVKALVALDQFIEIVHHFCHAFSVSQAVGQEAAGVW
jgi:hypothetical protein